MQPTSMMLLYLSHRMVGGMEKEIVRHTLNFSYPLDNPSLAQIRQKSILFLIYPMPWTHGIVCQKNPELCLVRNPVNPPTRM